jgi:hypothetical protein
MPLYSMVHIYSTQNERRLTAWLGGVTAAEYAENLEANLLDLLDRVKSGRYQAPPVRRAYIPKADGSRRPLGLPTFEDKVCQRAIVMVLELVYEQEHCGDIGRMNKMKSRNKEITMLMDALFVCLDKAKLAPATVLKSDAQKEHYESLVMFAYRKFQAARYHRERVTHLNETWQSEMEDGEAFGTMLPDKNASKMMMRVSRTANEFSYELSAFFAALRSSVDFLARVCVLHSKGVQADSVSNFIKWIGQGKTGPTLDVFANHTKWLEHLREYRDHIVHRLVIGTVSGGQREWEHGVWHSTTYPIVVPADTPEHVPDTRRARALAEPEQLFIVSTSKGTVTNLDGSTVVIEKTTMIARAEGYIKIEDLMDNELTAFESFFIDVLAALTKLDFQLAAIVDDQT